MNEAGLAVGMMAVPYAHASKDRQQITLGSIHVIRLLLDRAGSVDEALSLLRECNVDFDGGPPLHYLISDARGSSAVVEFVGGEISVLRNTEPWQVATNFVLTGHEPQAARTLCRRYDTAYGTLQGAAGHLAQQEALALLEDVSQQNTVWSVVYNLASGEITVAMGRNYDTIHHFKLEMEDG
jgi:choloylglycine hydrolase